MDCHLLRLSQVMFTSFFCCGPGVLRPSVAYFSIRAASSLTLPGVPFDAPECAHARVPELFEPVIRAGLHFASDLRGVVTCEDHKGFIHSVNRTPSLASRSMFGAGIFYAGL